MNSVEMSSEITLEKFKEKIERAYDQELLTEIQKKALLAKYIGLVEWKDRKPLTKQNRNALRILRDIVAHSSETTITLSKTLLRAYILQGILSIVDKPKGVLCPSCQVGTMFEGTTSNWINKKNYDLVIEQIPSRNCLNPDCEESIFSTDTVKSEEKIIAILDKEIPKVQKIEVTEKEEFPCPLCGYKYLKSNKKKPLYKHRQGLFHIHIKDVPLAGLCPRCGFEKHSEEVNKAINKMLEDLYEETFNLLETKP